MTQNTNQKVFNLDERTFLFARRVRDYVKLISKCAVNPDDKKQLIRSSGSVAANYIEANQAISPNDFSNRIRICRKEARESHLWLRLILSDVDLDKREGLEELIQEAMELSKIFGAITKKYTAK